MTTRVPAIEGWFTDGDEPRLLAQQGTETGAIFFPKSLAFSRNPAAPSEELTDTTLSRTGRVWSWTTNHYQPPAPYVAPDPFVPYTVVAVELVAEQMVVLGPLAAGDDPADLAMGAPVELTVNTLFTDDSHEYTMWAWKLTAPDDSHTDHEEVAR